MRSVTTAIATIGALLVVLTPSLSSAQSCGTLGSQCGNSQKYSCCVSGLYCQPWNENFYQCIATPAGCGSMETNVDYAGTDVASFYGLSLPSDCCNKCKENADCEFFVFVNQWGPACYLKKDMGAQKTLVGASVGRKTTTPTPTPTPTTPTPTTKTCPTLEQNVDYAGNDVGNVAGSGGVDCCAKCSQRSGCGAFTWSDYNGGTCWLKSSKGAASSKAGVVSGVVVSSTPTPTTPTPTTPTPTTPTPTTPTPTTPTPTTPTPTTPTPTTPTPGKSCPTLEQGIDYTGNDVGNVAGSGAADCCTKCAARAGCGAFTWNDYNGGTCWLKSGKGATTTKTGVVSAVVVTTTAPKTCPTIEQNVDYVGNDVGNVAGSNAADCCTKCGARTDCGAFTWNDYAGGTCWLKSGKGATTSKAGAVSAVVTTTTPTPTTPTPTTPTPTTPTPTTPAPVGKTCPTLEQNVDYSGNDIGNVKGSSAADCCTKCTARSDCGAFTWNDYNGGTCWLKSGKGASSSKAGAVSAVVVTGPTCVDIGASCSATKSCCDTGAAYCHPWEATRYQCIDKPNSCAAGLETDVDYSADLTNFQGVDLADCCDLCNANANCKVFTYVPAWRGCYLKSSDAGRKSATGTVSGKRSTTTPTPTTPTPTPTTPIPTTPTTPPPPGSWDPARCGQQKKYLYFHGNDIDGSETAYDTVEECCDYCKATPKCKLFTYFRRGAQKKCILKTGTEGTQKTNYVGKDDVYCASGVFA